jgi:hypothetical protein
LPEVAQMSRGRVDPRYLAEFTHSLQEAYFFLSHHRPIVMLVDVKVEAAEFQVRMFSEGACAA